MLKLGAIQSLVAVYVALGTAGCGHTEAERRTAALPSVIALQNGRFDEAAAGAQKVIAGDQGNPQAHVVSAITRFKRSGHQFFLDMSTLVAGIIRGGINHKYLRQTTEEFERELKQVDADLSVAAAHPEVDLELCIACWKVDWNHDGRIDSRDERLLEIEQDENGQSIPEDDARRKPTFHFDVGDVHWARAMVAFQRAFLDVILAYRFTDVDRIFASFLHLSDDFVLTIPIEHRERIRDARALILAGLDHSERARLAYLAETDDDREWVPNPRQKSHPLPLPVDARLYQTWEEVVGDVRRLVSGEEGIDIAEAAQLGEHIWEQPPGGFLDIGRLLSEPRDIVLDLASLKEARDEPEKALKKVLGIAYAPQMKRSLLLSRLARMKAEVKRGEEGFERKLRYLFWIN